MVDLPVIITAVLGLLSSGLAYLAYRRGKKADEQAAEVASTAQVYAGYGGLLESVQDDNRELRLRIAETEQRAAAAEQRAATAERRAAAAERRAAEAERRAAAAEMRAVELLRKLEELGRESAL